MVSGVPNIRNGRRKRSEATYLLFARVGAPPWGKERGGWYAPGELDEAGSKMGENRREGEQLLPFDLRGCAPLLLHRRRVPTEHAQQSAADAPDLGPPVIFCRQCANGLRPAARDGALPLPRLTINMLPNGNWAGVLPLVIRRLTAMEVMFLSWHRPCMRRQFCGDWKGGNPGMAAVQGNVIIVPCASGSKRALQWDEGQISLPHSSMATLGAYVEVALVGRAGERPRGVSLEFQKA